MRFPPGTTFGDLTVIREVERVGYNRRFECRCAGCGTVGVRWLSNLLQGKTNCLICVPMRERNRAGRAAVIAGRRARSRESDDGRVCLTCGEWKPWERFSADPRRTRGKASNCIDCAYWRTIKTLYGISRTEWEWLRDAQHGVCALCAEPGAKRLAIDHDHACCGRERACKKCIRGMLCSVCNRLLGHVVVKPALAARFSDYLERRPFSATSRQETSPMRVEFYEPAGTIEIPGKGEAEQRYASHAFDGCIGQEVPFKIEGVERGRATVVAVKVDEDGRGATWTVDIAQP
jgi:hypothetical protein